MKRIILIPDFFLAGIIAMIIVPFYLILIGTRKRTKANLKGYKLFVVFIGHSYKSIKTYGHEQLILQQGISGFFKKMYTFYPFLGANPFDIVEKPDGNMRKYELDEQNVFLEVHQAFCRFLSHLPRSNFLLSQWITLLRAQKFIINNRVSVIRGSEPLLTGLYSYLLSRLTGRPFALRIGSNFDLLYKNGLFTYQKIFKWHFIEKLLSQFILARADLVCAATQNYLEYAVANGCTRDKIILVRFGNIIDPVHLVEPADRLKIEPLHDFINKPFGIYIGRLTKIKYADHLIYVAAEVKRQFPDIVIVFIGDGDSANAMENEAIRCNVRNNVIFLGKQRQNFIASILPRATAYLAPHSGRSLVEAAYAAIPLIAYDWEWHSELVQQGITGELVPFKDWNAMARSFCKILSNPSYARMVGQNARRAVVEMMDPKNIQAIEKAGYMKILQGI